MPIVLPPASSSNAKTFLQLCQLTREKCGISGSGPTSVVGQTGEFGRIVNWVQESWLELQGYSPDWGWMRGDFAVNTVAGQQTYTPASASLGDFLRWHRDTLRIYRTSIGVADEQFIVEWDYQVFRDVYQYSSQTNSRPTVFAVHPNSKAILLGAIPDDVYTVRGEYQRAPRPLNSATDIPSLPEQHHMLIVYGAVRRYAFYENAPEVAVGAETMYETLFSQLAREELPDVTLGDAFA
jgi:hypothetical protein